MNEITNQADTVETSAVVDREPPIPETSTSDYRSRSNDTQKDDGSSTDTLNVRDLNEPTSVTARTIERMLGSSSTSLTHTKSSLHLSFGKAQDILLNICSDALQAIDVIHDRKQPTDIHTNIDLLKAVIRLLKDSRAFGVNVPVLRPQAAAFRLATLANAFHKWSILERKSNCNHAALKHLQSAANYETSLLKLVNDIGQIGRKPADIPPKTINATTEAQNIQLGTLSYQYRDLPKVSSRAQVLLQVIRTHLNLASLLLRHDKSTEARHHALIAVKLAKSQYARYGINIKGSNVPQPKSADSSDAQTEEVNRRRTPNAGAERRPSINSHTSEDNQGLHANGDEMPGAERRPSINSHTSEDNQGLRANEDEIPHSDELTYATSTSHQRPTSSTANLESSTSKTDSPQTIPQQEQITTGHATADADVKTAFVEPNKTQLNNASECDNESTTKESNQQSTSKSPAAYLVVLLLAQAYHTMAVIDEVELHILDSMGKLNHAINLLEWLISEIQNITDSEDFTLCATELLGEACSPQQLVQEAKQLKEMCYNAHHELESNARKSESKHQQREEIRKANSIAMLLNKPSASGTQSLTGNKGKNNQLYTKKFRKSSSFSTIQPIPQSSSRLSSSSKLSSSSATQLLKSSQKSHKNMKANSLKKIPQYKRTSTGTNSNALVGSQSLPLLATVNPKSMKSNSYSNRQQLQPIQHMQSKNNTIRRSHPYLDGKFGIEHHETSSTKHNEQHMHLLKRVLSSAQSKHYPIEVKYPKRAIFDSVRDNIKDMILHSGDEIPSFDTILSAMSIPTYKQYCNESMEREIVTDVTNRIDESKDRLEAMLTLRPVHTHKHHTKRRSHTTMPISENDTFYDKSLPQYRHASATESASKIANDKCLVDAPIPVSRYNEAVEETDENLRKTFQHSRTLVNDSNTAISMEWNKYIDQIHFDLCQIDTKHDLTEDNAELEKAQFLLHRLELAETKLEPSERKQLLKVRNATKKSFSNTRPSTAMRSTFLDDMITQLGKISDISS